MADEIEIGAEAIDRASSVSHKTIIETSNPATRDGTILKVKLYVKINIAGVRIGTCYAAGGGKYTIRDWQAVDNQLTG